MLALSRAGRQFPGVCARPLITSHLALPACFACRWRFTRKWQAEQMKQFEPPAAPGPNGGIAEGEEEEEWSEAMRLMDAVDGGLNQQIGRTLSLQNSSGIMEHSMGQDQSLTLMSPGLSQYMLLDGSIKEVCGVGWGVGGRGGAGAQGVDPCAPRTQCMFCYA